MKLKEWNNVDVLMKCLTIMERLHTRKMTPIALAKSADLNRRSVYRYLKTLEEAGFPIDKDEFNRYFIASDHCPVCSMYLVLEKTDSMTSKRKIQQQIAGIKKRLNCETDDEARRTLAKTGLRLSVELLSINKTLGS